MKDRKLEPSVPAQRRFGDTGILLLGALPGVLIGAYITGLLFFLNPELELTALAVLGGVVLYGVLFGSATALISLLLAGRSRTRARALLPWTITAALIGAAVSSWLQASWLSYYLHPGLNGRLLKAAILLSAAALIALLTALLHTMNSRRYGRRSKTLMVVLSVAVLYVMVERRQAFSPRAPRTPLPSEAAGRDRPALWVVGIDGATLDAVLPLAEQGHLPFFAQLLRRGVSTRLVTLDPILTPAAWTTLATGKRPYQHGVMGERLFPAGILSPGERLRLVPPGYRWWGFYGERSRYADGRARSALTLWEILSRVKIESGSIGWPSTVPAHEPLAFGFSSRYFSGDFRSASTRPQELAERGVLFRVEPEHLEAATLDSLGGTLPYPLLRNLAADIWREELADFLVRQKPEVEAFFLRLEGLGDVSKRYYGGFSRVHFDGAQDPEALEAERYVRSYYRHLDQFLASVQSKLPKDSVLVVLSAHGFDQPQGWRRAVALSEDSEVRGSTKDAPDGLLMMSGPGLREGVRLEDAELVDVLPTLLYGLDLPIARDLKGRVLTSAFNTAHLAQHPLSFVPSYESLTVEESDRADEPETEKDLTVLDEGFSYPD